MFFVLLSRISKANYKLSEKSDEITLTLEFCAQPLRPVWLMYVQIAELEKYVEFRAIKNLSGFNGFTSDYRS